MLWLSKIIPVRMRSTYGVFDTEHTFDPTDRGPLPGVDRTEHATWWQWRGRVMRHRVIVLG